MTVHNALLAALYLLAGAVLLVPVALALIDFVQMMRKREGRGQLLEGFGIVVFFFVFCMALSLAGKIMGLTA